ncbi:TonB-dependent receptor [Acinetobacter baumannii]|uniref:TonB-dependent receptor n=1 Tax=Acinetobacter baumannii TaxID=470 RepID=UPI001126EC10|nr:TonB-dependent receptor [Acinetobacter baumannii]EKT8143976.1 TonB-dependent receptor [Acinetobacter baumannii]EKU7086212.1 TonB-dependent receptor [Acinetobacter baumannii]EKV1042796.1 TonB-dependent receptor [Acinetobacter baumannii]EKV1046118.1 TonB-dependent receptor [Acinetobacter baumannii]EKV1919913.1 TonB-dependent receptor [Acinetobacter baumannii]
MHDFSIKQGFKVRPLAFAIACFVPTLGYSAEQIANNVTPLDTLQVQAEDTTAITNDGNAQATVSLNTIRVVASADASADGLMDEFAGSQVAKGGRVGLFGNQKNIETPFHLTSYTNQYIQEHQAKSIGDILQGDPSVRVARGYGNFQESYFIRGFLLGSDDTAYNGLYSILPRQYIPSELFERVEVLKGASAFLNGSTPTSGGLGGTINLLPKRSGNDPLNRVTVGTDFNGGYISNDVSRRFGEEQQFGVRVNTAYHGGNTTVDDEKASLGLASIGLDYRSGKLRLSGDMGYSNNRLEEPRPSVTMSGLSVVPYAPDSSDNFAQKWTYSNEEDYFGSYRAEYDFTDDVTVYGAYGFRYGIEENSIANPNVTNAVTGDGTSYRFDNARKDMVHTGEIGVRAKLYTGSVEHNLVLSGSAFQQNTRNAYVMDYFNTFPTNIYHPIYYSRPVFSDSAFKGNAGENLDIADPKLTTRTRLRSLAIGDNIKAFDDRLTVMLGARLQKIIQEGYDYETQAKQANTYEKSKLTPALGVSYKFTPELSVYANYIEGLAKGGTAPATAINQNTILEPYVSKQKEVGIKFENETLGVILDYFNTDRQRGLTNSNGYFGVDGKNVHQGVELNTYGQLTDSVKVLGGITWLDAKQKDTQSGLNDNNRVIGVPKFQANLEAGWQLPIPQDISVNGRIVYTGSSYADNANTLKVPDWTRVDIGAAYKTDLGQYPTTFNFRVNNVFDKDYWASVGGYEDNGYMTVSQPRTFMLSASFDF